ncbi:MAG TPA: BsuBI/PstI family type II restriction endonuclease [Chitinophaga sp.]|uniref:BsuBI/PstI family type II restriction endonuclease n=1 Tax=Chitinophaga sp. TaxID=1869181 RepID=UPI002DB76484|nr:BsuBI/PstI family type II restriction endonuclease [Chitinophaga sp.]HEU4555552.1 BsuBI/PstI family type II restriction endonuclease [Chitinophaga sp.]
MNITLPPYVTREEIFRRLPLIFPPGTPNRSYCIRELAASTIFAMLYIGAVEGAGVYLGPKHVYRMTHEHAVLHTDEDRLAYTGRISARNAKPEGHRWYADNTREPIRDETLREGLLVVGAVGALSNVDTTSGKPRYYLKQEFAALFDPALEGGALEATINSWRERHLSKSALDRIKLASFGMTGDRERVLVTFPNGETRSLPVGGSSEISKAVIEMFAPRFLRNPAVIWLSTSRDKVVTRDDQIAAAIGLNIAADKNLPDIILVDIGASDAPNLVVFVEVVATDGAINERRQNALYEITDRSGFDRKHVFFVTAYGDRESVGFKKTVQGLAWNSFAWFVSEPDKIVMFKDEMSFLSELRGG